MEEAREEGGMSLHAWWEVRCEISPAKDTLSYPFPFTAQQHMLIIKKGRGAN